MAPLIQSQVVVTHTHFDRVAIQQASARARLEPPDCTWLDSARVCRRVWADCAKSGYGLRALCKRVGYKFQHHHALEDAKAAGHVLLAAMADCGMSLDGLLHRVEQPINGASSSGRVQRDGVPVGALYGEVMVFTGSLQIPRRGAADLAAASGMTVAARVTRRTTLLVVGDIDAARLAGHEKSSKHRKAGQLAADGLPIRIIQETDFRSLVKPTLPSENVI